MAKAAKKPAKSVTKPAKPAKAAKVVKKTAAKPAKAAPADPGLIAALLAAVLAAPDDDGTRLVYADHLTTAGDPRGEFIAVQCALAQRGDKTERQDPKTKPLWNRFRELHSRHSAKWTKPLKALGPQTKWELHRGFVRALHVSGETTPAQLAELLALEPVVNLSLEPDHQDLSRFLDVPGVERVRRLVVWGYHDAKRNGAFIGPAIAAAKRLGALTELRVGFKLQDAGIAALANATNLRSVVRLAVGASDAAPATIRALVDSPLGQRLEVLEWMRSTITPKIAEAVARLPQGATFVASFGEIDETEAHLRQRFGARFFVEDEPGTEYIDGVKHVSLGTFVPRL